MDVLPNEDLSEVSISCTKGREDVGLHVVLKFHDLMLSNSCYLWGPGLLQRRFACSWSGLKISLS